MIGFVMLAIGLEHGRLRVMRPSRSPYRGFGFPAEIIAYAVWLHHCFSLSLRDVERILAARGVTVSYESIRDCGIRFGRQFAAILKRRRPKPGDKWHLDGVFIRIRGKLKSYAAAKREILTKVEHRQSRYLNNRAGVSHQLTQRRERQMQRFKSVSQAQRFLSAHSRTHSHFQLRRHLIPAAKYRSLSERAFSVWQDVACVDTAA